MPLSERPRQLHLRLNGRVHCALRDGARCVQHALRRDLDSGYAGLFAGEPSFEVNDDGDDYAPNDNWGGVGEIHPTDHSVAIRPDELLLASAEQRDKYYAWDEDDPLIPYKHGPRAPEEVEFLGNGPQYMGRCYGRVAILVWPRANRARVQAQSPAGAAAQARAAAAAAGEALPAAPPARGAGFFGFGRQQRGLAEGDEDGDEDDDE